MLEIIVQFYGRGGNNTQDAERGSRNDEAGNPEGISFATQQLSPVQYSTVQPDVSILEQLKGKLERQQAQLLSFLDKRMLLYSLLLSLRMIPLIVDLERMNPSESWPFSTPCL